MDAVPERQVEIRAASAEEMEAFGFVINSALATNDRTYRDPTNAMRPGGSLST